MRDTLQLGRSICRACGSASPEPFYEVRSIPTQTCVLLETATEAAAYPTGRIELAFCGSCGFIQNNDFDATKVDYSQPTEESQAFSPEFTRFADDLAARLVERHALDGDRVLEVGCGKGDFLELLVEHGVATGIGIDPGYLPNREVSTGSLEFIKDWFGPTYTHLTGNLVLTRHLLEHVPNVAEFTGWLLDSVVATPGAALFTEVPDVLRVLREGAFWDIYYEHCSYFTLGSLGRMLRAGGLRLHGLETGFGDQYLLADGVPGRSSTPEDAEEPIEVVAAQVSGFATHATEQVAMWTERVSEQIALGEPVVVWGGGSKAVAFLAALGISDDRVTVVDINPHKQGKFLPGTGIEVKPPTSLKELDPRLVIPMNPIYAQEIRADLSSMSLEPEVVAL